MQLIGIGINGKAILQTRNMNHLDINKTARLIIVVHRPMRFVINGFESQFVANLIGLDVENDFVRDILSIILLNQEQ